MQHVALTVLMSTAVMPIKKDSEAKIMEAVHVAAAIKGGAALVHKVQMMNKVEVSSM